MDLTRNGNGYAAYRLTHSDILDWASLRRKSPDEWEIDAILAMDAVRLDTDDMAREEHEPVEHLKPGMLGMMISG